MSNTLGQEGAEGASGGPGDMQSWGLMYLGRREPEWASGGPVVSSRVACPPGGQLFMHLCVVCKHIYKCRECAYSFQVLSCVEHCL